MGFDLELPGGLLDYYAETLLPSGEGDKARNYQGVASGDLTGLRRGRRKSLQKTQLYRRTKEGPSTAEIFKEGRLKSCRLKTSTFDNGAGPLYVGRLQKRTRLLAERFRVGSRVLPRVDRLLR